LTEERTLKRSLIVAVLSGLFALTLGTSVAFAGSPQFVGAPTFAISGDQGKP
jgi:ABC-type Fe3+ transport system permease subunit